MDESASFSGVRRSPPSLLLPLAVLSLLLRGAPLARADGPVLHEYVPDVDENEALLAVGQVDGMPGAIEQDGQVLPAPEAGASSAPPMVAAQGDGMLGEQPGRRSPTFRPDRMTELEGRLSYYAAFNPAIAPFKRVTALDRVVLAPGGSTPVLALGGRRLTRVPVEGADAPDPDGRPRDRFWGEARLDFSGGVLLPLPSVSPESRILSLRSEPSLPLQIKRDAADNFFVELSGRPPPRPVFVAFLTDAPRGYFGMEIPRVPIASATETPPPVPPSVRARALRFAAELGLSPDDDLRTALHRLTAHFRGFEESAEPPDDSGDIYLDLVRSEKGVCRHRAYGFVVTAQALGIDARFVQNEAHSWVEVRLPAGFLRIDLGGAAEGLDARDTQHRAAYQPVEPDRLPRPPAYEESYTQASRAAQMRSPDPEQLEGRWVSPDAQEQGAARASSSAAFMAGPDSSLPPDESGRAPLSIQVDQRRTTVQRGREITVTGRIEDAAGQGAAGLRVEVSLAAPDRRERMLLGVTVSGEDGYFRGVFGIPPDLGAGDYRLVVITPGDDTHLPAIAD
ncbi:MAG: transglutaminase domain-containing protein [Myxococcales bacterium]|jgi:hypothetical protein